MLFHFVVFFDVPAPCFFIVLSMGSENFVEETVICFVQMVRQKMAIPLMRSCLWYPVFFGERLNFAIEL